jgi:hypothetical protein
MHKRMAEIARVQLVSLRQQKKWLLFAWLPLLEYAGGEAKA